MKNIKILEVQKDDIKTELRQIEFTIQKLEQIKEEVKPNTTAVNELKIFLDKLKQQKEINSDLLNEYDESIKKAISHYLEEQNEEAYFNKKYGDEK